MFWNRLAIVAVLILAMWLHFIGEAADRNAATINRNAASLGALWARVDSLENNLAQSTELTGLYY